MQHTHTIAGKTNCSKTLKGMFHVHSNFSFDGQNAINEIVQFLKKRDYDFLCLTEHANDFDEKKMGRFLMQCNEHSSDAFLILPGIEYNCDNTLHLIVVGSKIFYNCEDPLSIAKKAHKENALSIIAHPRGYEKAIATHLLKAISGVEIWNGQKDSRFIPHYNSFKTFKHYKIINPQLIAMGGSDLHNLNKYFPLDLVIKGCSLDRDSVIENLKQGNFSVYGNYWKITSPNLSSASLCLLFVARKLLNFLRNSRDTFLHCASLFLNVPFNTRKHG